MLWPILMLSVKCLLSAATVAVTVTSSLELVTKIEQAMEHPHRRVSAVAIGATAMKVCIALLVLGALSWRLVRHVPFAA